MAQDHVIYLGKLVANLQSLEALLRVYLQKIAKKKGEIAASDRPYWNLSVGDLVPKDAFTNFDSLGNLVDKFNADVGTRDNKLKIHKSVVEIRDLLAHGRIAADSQDLNTMKILKFDRPSEGSVRVTAAAVMDEAWFEKNIRLVFDQIELAQAAYRRYAS